MIHFPKLRLKPLLDLLLYSHLLLATAAAALTWATGRLLHQRLPFALPWLAGAATLLLYNLDGLMPYKRRQPVTTARGHWLRAHTHILMGLALLGLGSALPLAVFLLLPAGGQAVRLLVPLALLAGLYSVPVVPWGGRRHPLRDVPLLKGVLIAGVWAGVTVALPALLGAPPAPQALQVLLWRRFLFVLALSLAFDLRDMEKDQAAGTLTVPLALGAPRTKWLAWVLLAIVPLLQLPHLSLTANLLQATPIAAAAAWVAGVRPGRADYYYAGLGDGLLLLPAIAEWLSSQLS